ncbi:MAG: aldo/keto reductase [Anaerolineales bacterium]
MSSQVDLIRLGTSEVMIPRMGVGAWAWGDTLFWNYGRDFDRADVEEAFADSVEAGLTFFDTAEIYGFGRSEKILSELIPTSSTNLQIATKFMPYPWRVLSGQLEKALQGSLDRLHQQSVDLYQIHQPLPFRSQDVWLRAMLDQHRNGRLRAIGVSNFNLRQTRNANEILTEQGFSLASNQVEYSLLDRAIESSGLLEYCQNHGVTVIAYSPLAQGLLTGKYSADNPPPGARGRRVGRRTWERLEPLLAVMKRIGQEQGGHSPAQVALNWVMAKGAVPIPGAKNGRQARDNAGALGWELSQDQIAELDRLSSQ